jgi:hypothetical protein
MEHLWVIRMVSNARNNATLTAEVDKKLSEKPPALSDEQWLAAQEAILLRRKQLSERLSKTDTYASPDRAETLACQLIQQAQKGQ